MREYIQPKPGAKEIYFGLPLRPEYRIFVDFDSDRILGCSPYWEPEMMKKRFGHSADSTKPDKVHDNSRAQTSDRQSRSGSGNR